MSPKINPFKLFMDEQKRTNPDFQTKTFDELRHLCGPLWDKLTNAEQEVYKNRVRAMRPNMPGTVAAAAEYDGRHHGAADPKGARDIRGRYLVDVAREQQELKDKAEKEKKLVEDTVRMTSQDDSLAEVKFRVAYVNVFDDGRSTGNVLPVELAVVEFSLADGVTMSFNEFVDPGPLPTNFSRAMAVAKAGRTHKIELADPVLRKDYEVLARELCDFVASEGAANNPFGPNVIFTLPEEKYKGRLEKVLKWLHEKTGEDDLLSFKILDLSQLLFLTVQMNSPTEELASRICPSMILAQTFLKADEWSWDPGYNCKFHAGLDVANGYCSLARARRYAYLLCSYCCPVLDLDQKAGCHYPPKKEQKTYGWSSYSVAPPATPDVDEFWKTFNSKVSIDGEKKRQRGGKSQQY